MRVKESIFGIKCFQLIAKLRQSHFSCIIIDIQRNDCEVPTQVGNPDPGKLNTAFWENMAKQRDEELRDPLNRPQPPRKVSLYGKSFYDDKAADPDTLIAKPETLIVCDRVDDHNDDDQEKVDNVNPNPGKINPSFWENVIKKSNSNLVLPGDLPHRIGIAQSVCIMYSAECIHNDLFMIQYVGQSAW